MHVCKQALFEGPDLIDRQVIQEALGCCVDRNNLVFHLEWCVLILLKKLGQALSTRKLLLGRLVEVGCELGECLYLTVLSKLQLDASGDLLHSLDLCITTNTGYRDTHVDSRTDTCVEEVRLEEDLSIGDGNDVRWDIRGNVTSLCLDDWECGQRSTGVWMLTNFQVSCVWKRFESLLCSLWSSFTFVDVSIHASHSVCRCALSNDEVVLTLLSSTLQQAGVEIKDVAGIRFASWWASKEEGNLAVCNCLL